MSKYGTKNNDNDNKLNRPICYGAMDPNALFLSPSRTTFKFPFRSGNNAQFYLIRQIRPLKKSHYVPREQEGYSLRQVDLSGGNGLGRKLRLIIAGRSAMAEKL